MRNITFIVLLIFCSQCNSQNSLDEVLPIGELELLDEFYYWNYDFKVYSVDTTVLDSNFSDFPTLHLCSYDSRMKISNWDSYEKYDTIEREGIGIDTLLYKCDLTKELYNQILNGSEIYYSGCYTYAYDLEQRRFRNFHKILLFDSPNRRIYIITKSE